MTQVTVVYASKHGSTHEIAEVLAEEFRAAGLEAVLEDAKDVRGIDGDALVLGSAIYMGRWRREAKHVLDRQADAIKQIPFWIFSTGAVGDPAKEPGGDQAERWLEPQQVVERATELGVRGHVVFGGSLADPPEGMMQKAMAKDMPDEFKDRRDWDEIRAWARGVAAELGAPVTTG